MSHGSKTVVYAAIGGNTLVMLAKVVAFALTGSGAMLAEFVHSLADLGNQVLLAVGLSRGKKAADDEHPFGHARDAFVWAFISAVGIFFIGCGVSVAHGVHTLMSEHHEVSSPGVALAVLALSFCIEGSTLGVATRSVSRAAKARGLGIVEHIRTTGDPFGIAVLLEDSAAVLGVIVAAAAIGLTHLTHDAMWDGLGSIAIGVLLGFVALFLISKNRTMLIGRAVGSEQRERIAAILREDPAVEAVRSQKTAITGADSFRITAELDFDGRVLADRYLEGRDLAELSARLSDPAELRAFLGEFSEQVTELVGDEVDRIEARIREDLPHADQIAIEVD